VFFLVDLEIVADELLGVISIDVFQLTVFKFLLYERYKLVNYLLVLLYFSVLLGN